MRYTNSEIASCIDEHIHSQVKRDILKSRLIDGMLYDDLAEMYGYSVRQVKRIVYKGQEELLKHLEP